MPSVVYVVSKPGRLVPRSYSGISSLQTTGVQSHLLYVDDLKVFAASESKLNTVLRATSDDMLDIGLHWNP